MSDFLKGLNDAQLEAAKHKEGTLIILAGAGCGKTKVLTSRIAELVASGISPYEILAVTFTNKAAGEMKNRLVPFLGEDAVKKMWVGTFHSIAGKILRYDIENYISPSGMKYDKSYVIYDDTDTNAVIKNVLKQLNIDEKIYAPKTVKSVISDAKNKMMTAYDFATHARSYRDEKYAKIFEEYEKILNLNNALDFDDMILVAGSILRKNPEVREKYYKRFKHILVDEFQDTNIAQYSFIKSIYTNENPMFKPEGRSLCTVGDIDQSIYGWRGADYTILLNMQKNFPDAKLIKLEQNYRSTATVLGAANAVIENNFDRVEKNLYSNLGKGELIEVYEAGDDNDEALHIVSEIKNLTRNGDFSLNNCAVLYRANSQSRKLEEACMANSLPYKMVGGLKFYDRAEIKDILAYMKFIYNQSDSQSLSRIINVPKRGIGETTLKKIRDIAYAHDVSMFDVISNIDDIDDFSSGVKTKLKNFIKEMNSLFKKREDMNIPDFITALMEDTGYLKMLEEDKDPVAEGKIDNLQELINVAQEFQPTEPDNEFGEFLTQVALVSDIDSYEDEKEAVTLMTLHSAKGLEFEVVFIAGLDEGLFPHGFSGEFTKTAVDDVEEERRIMYVGITRAKKLLFLSHAKRRMMWGNYKFYEPSRFLSEIPSDLVNRIYSEKDYSYDGGIKFASRGESSLSRAVKNLNLRSNPDGSIASVTSFGKNFSVPGTNNTNGYGQNTWNNSSYRPQRTQNRAFVSKKNSWNSPSEREKIRKIIDNNPMKEKYAQYLKQKELEPKPPAPKFFEGDRVFHTKFGIGKIKSVDDENCIVEFGSYGEKNLANDYSMLKKF